MLFGVAYPANAARIVVSQSRALLKAMTTNHPLHIFQPWSSLIDLPAVYINNGTTYSPNSLNRWSSKTGTSADIAVIKGIHIRDFEYSGRYRTMTRKGGAPSLRRLLERFSSLIKPSDILAGLDLPKCCYWLFLMPATARALRLFCMG
jgi:hypothetical protein